MSIEQLTPWISLVSGVLSIGYLVGDEMRRWSNASTADREGSRNVSLAAALRKHDIVILTAVTLFSVAGLAHWYLRSTAYF